jgi:hypothetical protein
MFAKIPREVDLGNGCKTKKMRMERLQWGFPIATALSLNMPTSINGQKKNKKKTSHGMTRKNAESNQ